MLADADSRSARRVAILCNGAFPTAPYPLHLLDTADAVVCCDGAADTYLAHTGGERLPQAVVGDLDSLSEASRRVCAGCLVWEEEQETNDLCKAVRHVLATFPALAELDILGATGLREDHTVGNLGLLMDFPRMFPALAHVRVSMVSDFGTAFALCDTCTLCLGEGRRVSLFSADNSLKVVSSGLQWPTDAVTFDAWWKATLNRTVSPEVTLRFSHPSRLLVLVD